MLATLILVVVTLLHVDARPTPLRNAGYSFAYNLTVLPYEHRDIRYAAMLTHAYVSNVEEVCGLVRVYEHQQPAAPTQPSTGKPKVPLQCCGMCLCWQPTARLSQLHATQFNPDDGSNKLLMSGQGTYGTVSTLDFMCELDVSWYAYANIATTSPPPRWSNRYNHEAKSTPLSLGGCHCSMRIVQQIEANDEYSAALSGACTCDLCAVAPSFCGTMRTTISPQCCAHASRRFQPQCRRISSML